MTELFAPVYNLIVNKMESLGEDGLSIMAIKNIFVEYQRHVTMIENQLQMCVKDHEFLKQNLADVVDENRRLLKQLKDKNEKECGSKSLFKLEESLLVRNLQHQLSITTSERDTIKEMLVLSTKSLDDLQTELCRYKEEMESKAMCKQINALKSDYTEAINLLERKLVDIKADRDKQKERNVELDIEVKQIRKEIAATNERNKLLESQLVSSTELNEELKKKCLVLEAKCAYFESESGCRKLSKKEEIEDSIWFKKLKTERDEMQKALEQCLCNIEILSKNMRVSEDRVVEAVKLVEDAQMDKENAVTRAVQAEGECRRLELEMKGLIDEAGFQVSRELAASKKAHTEELTVLQMDLKIAKQDNANKSAEIGKLTSECSRLENMIKQINTTVREPSKLDKKLETYYSNLYASEEKNLQIKSENEALKQSYEGLRERHSRCKLEKVLLNKQIFLLGKQIENLTNELIATKHTAASFLHSYENGSGNEELLQKLQEIQDKNVATTNELQRHVEAHDEIARKWKNEVVTLKDTFETKLQKVKSDLKAEKKKSKQLYKLKSQDITNQHLRYNENSDIAQDDDLQKL